ncbi:MAG: polysulfide reductase NrfD [Bdellovibrionaceae bacterium]|jgi:Ni/Fe-hydrogenase subunit HybB-like protein|nr:polysulfide reductase NrfD [Pseudobdellovibrionaceae bacterium]
MISYINYWINIIKFAFIGGKKFYLWTGFLSVLIGLGFAAYTQQFQNGLIVTNLSDQVSWGAYIANFTFLVGVAAAAVLLVVPTYIYKRDDVKEVVLIGELLAISAIVMCLLFIIVDMGRPDRFMHIIPFIGRLNFPASILAWDVVVLNGYLILNLHIPGYLLYKMYKNQNPSKKYYMPFVIISIFWAVSIHTVTAFLYSGLGGRPYWNSAILAPRFLISAFASGPALMIIIFALINHFTNLKVKQSVSNLLLSILKVTLPINMFLLGSELFKEFYTDSTHALSAHYLFFGINGHAMLAPFIWSSILFSFIAMAIIFIPKLRNNKKILYVACVLTFIGIWIEKGMGLIIPGFIPTPIGDLVEYTPSMIEFLVSVGIWSIGGLIFTLMVKVAIAIQTGELREKKKTA